MPRRPSSHSRSSDASRLARLGRPVTGSVRSRSRAISPRRAARRAWRCSPTRSSAAGQPRATGPGAGRRRWRAGRRPCCRRWCRAARRPISSSSVRPVRGDRAARRGRSRRVLGKRAESGTTMPRSSPSSPRASIIRQVPSSQSIWASATRSPGAAAYTRSSTDVAASAKPGTAGTRSARAHQGQGSLPPLLSAISRVAVALCRPLVPCATQFRRTRCRSASAARAASRPPGPSQTAL